MNEKLNQVLLLVGETNFEDQNTSTVKSAFFCVNFLFNSVDIKPLHFHFPNFYSVFIAHVITFHCGFLTRKVPVSLLAMVRFEHLAYVVFRWCTVVHIPR